MEQEDDKRTKWINIRLKPGEFKMIDTRFKKTMCRKMSEYIRNVLLEKNEVVTCRDKSMDEVLEELILLRRELNAIGSRFWNMANKYSTYRSLSS